MGPSKADILAKEFDIHTYGDLLHYFPFRVVDRSHISTIDNFNNEEPYLVFRGRISDLHTVTSGRSTRLEATFTDGTGTMLLVWFQGLKWIKESLKPGSIYNVMGKPSLFGSTLQLVHPDLEVSSLYDERPTHAFLPVYRTTEKAKARGLGTKAIARITSTLLQYIPKQLSETLPISLIQKYHLMDRGTALRKIHYPDTLNDWQQAMLREKFEELFYHQLDYQYSRISRRQHSVGRIFGVVGNHFNNFYNNHLPFPLTGAQNASSKRYAPTCALAVR